MADAEISILIKAQNEMSAELTKISKQIDGFVKNNEKQTKSLSQSWSTATNSLIAIGNAASAVDSIFSSLSNLELRLENATERLANAQDRLTDSTQGVVDAQKDLAFTNERLERLASAGITTGQQVIDL